MQDPDRDLAAVAQQSTGSLLLHKFCASCGHNVTGLGTGMCQECGARIDFSDRATFTLGGPQKKSVARDVGIVVAKAAAIAAAMLIGSFSCGVVLAEVAVLIPVAVQLFWALGSERRSAVLCVPLCGIGVLASILSIQSLDQGSSWRLVTGLMWLAHVITVSLGCSREATWSHRAVVATSIGNLLLGGLLVSLR